MQIGLLGPLEVRDGAGTPVEVGGVRARTLLALLALAPGRVVTGATLIDRIWGSAPPDAAANALQALVSRLRRRLPPGVLESQPSGYRLAVAPAAVDVWRFEQLLAAGEATLGSDPAQAAAALDQALALWRGPALADLAAARTTAAEATRLEELRVRAIEDRAEADLLTGNGHDHLPDLEALVAQRPTRERAVGLLMRALVADDRSGDALTAYERTRTALAERLGADPSPELAALHRRILRREPDPRPGSDLGDDRAGPAAGPMTGPMTGPPTNLRTPLTSFIGRDDDLPRIAKLMGEFRLTTLTGPGGSGKTRLAVESARGLFGQATDGVWLVELARLTDPAEVPHAVLATLGQRDRLPRRPPRTATWEPGDDDAVDRLALALSARAVLLVLDNCEHLVSAVAGLAERLLGACPRLRILATSREPLGLTGEAVWPVQPLALPPPGAGPAQARESAAIRLLTDRALAAAPGLTFDDRTITAAARICRALDGIPLAIELAAARLRTLSPAQLADRLDDRFRLLTNGSRTALPRHQTLRATVDWSWNLLEPEECVLLRRLAYFSGGVSLAAAEQVCAGDGVPVERVLDLLTTLVDKSLLTPDWRGGEQPRYRMLETIKAYGLAKLAEVGETERVRRAHTAYFLALAETAEPLLRTGEQRDWLDRLAADHENLQAVLRTAISAGDAGTAVRLVAALGWYWSLSGHRREALPLAGQAIALPGEVPAETRALAYSVVGCAAVDIVPDTEVQSWFQTAADLAASGSRQHPMLRLVGPLTAVFEASTWPGRPDPALDPLVDDPDPWVRGTALNMRIYLTLNVGVNHPGLADDVAAALAAFQASGDQWGVAFTLQAAASLAALAGDLDAAVARTEEAVAALSGLGIPEDTVQFQAKLAELRWVRGDVEGAWRELERARRIADRLGMPTPLVTTALAHGDLARLTGDLATARSALDQAWTLAGSALPAPEQRATIACSRGHLSIAAGDPATAHAEFDTALELGLTSGAAPVIARAMVGLADLALAGGDPDRAAELLGTAAAVRGGEDLSLPDPGRVAAAAGVGLGEARFAKAYARGRDCSPTEQTLREQSRTTPGA